MEVNMSTLIIAILSFFGFIIAYHTYGRWLARKIFGIDPEARVPSQELRDDVDYVPTKKEIIFGHHFTSIAGTGPIVGPAIARFLGMAARPALGCAGVNFYRCCSRLWRVGSFAPQPRTDGRRHRGADDHAACEVAVSDYPIHGTDRCFGYLRPGHCYHLRALPRIGAFGSG